jgi:DNA-nicking Smr family endonuclease
MAKSPDKKRGGGDDEARLFEAAMRGVAPLPGKTGEPAPEPGAEPERPAAPSPSAPPAAPSPAPLRRAAMPELRPGIATDLDARTMERLRRGRVRPEARLDLHGLTQDEAHGALTRFIADSRRAGRRCVIVITGRGRSKLGGGILREQTPRWLNLAPVRGNILGFAQAQPKDGGSGAIYVLLRKKRP